MKKTCLVLAQEVFNTIEPTDNIKLYCIKHLGLLTDKLLNDNMYEIELDLVQLFRLSIAWLKYDNISLEDFTRLVDSNVHYRVVTSLDPLELLKHLNKFDPYSMFNFTFDLINLIMGLETFVRTYYGFIALMRLRMLFSPSQYERLWNGIPDTEYVYKHQDETRNVAEWLELLFNICPIKHKADMMDNIVDCKCQ